MINLRAFYTKTGRAKYISHLDMNRCMDRAIKRSGLPVWYTEGFNPHIYTTFALPISLGFESLCESMDFRLVQELPLDEVAERLNACLPEGIRVLRVAPPVLKPEAIKWADYQIKLWFDGRDSAEIVGLLTAAYDRPELVVTKKTKRSQQQIDIKPLIAQFEATAHEDAVQLQVRLAAGIHTNINPMLLVEELCTAATAKYNYIQVLRQQALTEQLTDFE